METGKKLASRFLISRMGVWASFRNDSNFREISFREWPSTREIRKTKSTMKRKTYFEFMFFNLMFLLPIYVASSVLCGQIYYT